MTIDSNLTLEIYKGYALDEFDRWDAIIHPDVQANSPAGRGVVGLEALKRWNKAFTPLSGREPISSTILSSAIGAR